MDCLDVTRTVVQLECRPLSVGCGGVELPSSDTLPKPGEKYESVTSGLCRLSRLFLLGLVMVYQLESVAVVEVSWNIGSISFSETSGICMFSSLWTSDSFMSIIVSFFDVGIGCCFMNSGGFIGIMVSLLHVDIGCCLMNIGELGGL